MLGFVDLFIDISFHFSLNSREIRELPLRDAAGCTAADICNQPTTKFAVKMIYNNFVTMFVHYNLPHDFQIYVDDFKIVPVFFISVNS